ncbi:hypothetical protein [Methanolobus sp. WCC5]|uniref:hypothetical protein n=1 Tax=Methanolobus sp. WCC5 TaxID=3125785 RepID=UPI003250543E
MGHEERANDRIEDTRLIEWLIENYKKFSFYNIDEDKVYMRYERKTALDAAIGDLEIDKSLHLQREKLTIVWKELLALAIIYLKSSDERENHHDDGDYGIDELNEFFDEYCNFENMLYGSSEYYRDHVSHVFKVFLLGEYLVRDYLECFVESGEKKVNVAFKNIDVMDSKLQVKVNELEDKFKDKLKDTDICKDEKDIEYANKYMITPEEKEAMWCIVSLTHDLGYPMETVHKIHEQIRKMLDTFDVDVSYLLSHQSHVFNDSIIKLISSNLEDHHLIEIKDGKESSKVSFTTHVQAKYYSKFSRELEKRDHGIESCIILMKTLVYFLETDLSIDQRKHMNILDARHFLIRQRILRAIASHNSTYIYNLKMDLSFLLRIIDEMQEWGRPKLSDLFLTSPQEYNLNINWFEKDKIEYTIRIDNKPSELDDTTVHDFVRKYFKRKIDNYIKILRSAVDGDHREFTLIFNVIDSIEVKTKEKDKIDYTYTFEHPNPKDIKIQLTITKNSRPVMEKKDISLSILNEKTWDKFLQKANGQQST